MRMRPGMKIVLAALLVAVLVVPAAAAKPGKGNGNGNGGGKPSWAGPKTSGGGGEKAERGRPSWAGQGKAKQAERSNGAAKGKRGPARDGDEADAGPRKLNPAFVCRFERETLGDEAFGEAYGTNENRANAFGKCVSREAKDRDGVAEGDGEEPEAPEEGEEPEDDGTELPDEEPADAAAVLSLLRFLL